MTVGIQEELLLVSLDTYRMPGNIRSGIFS